MPFKPQELIDSVTTLEAGVNQGISPLLLQKNQMSASLNLTVRGTYANPRPPFRKIALDYGGDAALQMSVEKPKWQKGVYYKPDSGLECLVACIAGRLFQFQIDGTTAHVADKTGANPLSPVQTQAWLWQAEKWIIAQDGISNPLFYARGDTGYDPAVQSGFGTMSKPTTYKDTTQSDFTIPAIGSAVNIQITDATHVSVGDVFTVAGTGRFQVTGIGSAPTYATVNLTGLPALVVPTGTVVTWPHVTNNPQLPPGRMGTYGMGRVWMSLTDAKSFIGSDAVGGSSGTQAESYRDAVLNVTENTYLAGGGLFVVPGSIGDIHFMKFTATLDTSLGQGPMQVGVPTATFSVNSPTDRTTWQDVTNPILTQSLISNGGLSQESTVNANSDLIMRSSDGIISLILARREDNTWGIVPISREVSNTLSQDDPSLLIFDSAVVFDNRLLMTCSPVATAHGVYHRALVALNFDPISSLRGKAPSVYDGIWSGVQVLQIITGRFSNVQRCFLFTLNTFTDTLELYELLPSITEDALSKSIDIPSLIYDNGTSPVTFTFDTASMFNYPKENDLSRTLKRLLDGEIQVDNLRGKVHFEILYKPDQWPCWVPWHQWDECSVNTGDRSKPGFRPRMGFGEPSPNACDPYTNRVHREAYTFQIKVIVTGYCEVLAVRLKAVTIPETPFAPIQGCDPICTT